VNIFRNIVLRNVKTKPVIFLIACCFSCQANAQTYPPNETLYKLDQKPMEKPGFAETKVEPTYNTLITRITDKNAFDIDEQVSPMPMQKFNHGIKMARR